MKSIAYVGMDVHKDSIAIAVLYAGKSEKEDVSTIKNKETSINVFSTSSEKKRAR